MNRHNPLPHANRIPLWESTISGLAAGLLMMLALMIRARLDGFSFWFPLQQVAAVLSGVEALIGGGQATLAGALVHLGVSALFGLGFGLIAFWARSLTLSVLVGAAYGFLIWAAMTFLILAFINPVMSERVALIPAWWLGSHLLFGATLAPATRLFPEKRFRRSHSDAPEPSLGYQPSDI